MEKRLENYIESLSKLINIPTLSNGSNYDKEVFDKFHQELKNIFPNLFKTFKYEEFDGSILLSYVTESDKEPVLLMSHHDVVSSNGEWEHEAFNAVVDNEKLYGRGTLDTKGNLWAILTSIEELLSEGYKLNRSIYIESSCNEETSSEGAYIISRELLKRNVHFDFTLDEGGMIVYDPIGGADGTFAMIALAEKDCLDFKFTAKSKGGHASTPDKTNPIFRLAQFVSYVETHNVFKPKLDDLYNSWINKEIIFYNNLDLYNNNCIVQNNYKIVNYIDIPIQHASNNVLKSMARRTTKEEITSAIDNLRKEIPDIALRTTFITGFPGETKKDFGELLEFIEKLIENLRFDRLGVFTYSREEGTKAAVMKSQVPALVKKHRRDKAMKLQQCIVFEQGESMVGRIMEVMIEGRLVEENVYVGRTYRDAPGVDGSVFVAAQREIISGDFVQVKITGCKGYDLIGEIIEE